MYLSEQDYKDAAKVYPCYKCGSKMTAGQRLCMTCANKPAESNLTTSRSTELVLPMILEKKIEELELSIKETIDKLDKLIEVNHRSLDKQSESRRKGK